LIDTTLDALAEGWRWTAPDGMVLPTQPRVLGLALQGRRAGAGWQGDATWGLLDALAILDEVVAVLLGDDPAWRIERTNGVRDGFHPGRTAVLTIRGVEVGVVGQLHPAEAEQRDLPEPVIVGELLLEPMLLALNERAPTQAKANVKHQAMTLDVAVIAPDAITYATLERAVREGAGALLDDLRLFDVYRGEQVGDGNRSVAMALRLQAPDRQLTDEDAAATIQSVATAVDAAGGSLRR
jgi:phenylalanyl-tRNA synthetase beta chain